MENIKLKKETVKMFRLVVDDAGQTIPVMSLLRIITLATDSKTSDIVVRSDDEDAARYLESKNCLETVSPNLYRIPTEDSLNRMKSFGDKLCDVLEAEINNLTDTHNIVMSECLKR